MNIHAERIYDPPQHAGYRVLTDRLWPRGMTKQRAQIDEWCKALSPSTQLRIWFSHDVEKWPEFSRLYRLELVQARDEAHELLRRAGKKPLILLTSTKDMQHTHALVLRDYLASLGNAR